MKIINILLKLLICIIFFVNIINVVPNNVVYADNEDPAAKVIGGADDFLAAGNENKKEYVDGEQIKKVSDSLYNTLFAIGGAIALIVGIILGIQFITSGVEGQAKVKESLIAYGIGCAVLFGSFGIWKLVIILFGEIFPKAVS